MKLRNLLFLFALLLLFVACEGRGVTTLSQYTATSYPSDTNHWIVEDATATTEAFAGLRAAIDSVSRSTRREITVEFSHLTSIPDSAIYSRDSLSTDALVRVIAPKAASIGESAFRACRSLRSVNFPLVTKIDRFAFCDCNLLTAINLATSNEAKLLSVDKEAFNDTSTAISLTLGRSNRSYVSGSTLAVGDFSATFKKIIIDGVVQQKPSHAMSLADFSATSYPTEGHWVICDDTATTETFAGLRAAIDYVSKNNIRQITLEFPNLTAIPAYAIVDNSDDDRYFYSCALVAVIAPKATSIGRTALANCHELKSVDFPRVTKIGETAFSSCDALTSVYFPLVTELDRGAFAHCRALPSVDFPLVTHLAHMAFYNCCVLKRVNFPQLTEIDTEAFYNCEELTTFAIPSTVNAIGDGAFAACDKLTEFVVESPYFLFSNGILYNSDKSRVVSALPAVVSGDITLPRVTSVSSYAFRNCHGLTSVSLPLVTEIGSSAFRECSGLTAVSLATGKGVKLSSMDTEAFFCSPITNITLTIGSANRSYVWGRWLTVGRFRDEFKQIVVR